jgi:4-hydroxymandelate synthase
VTIKGIDHIELFVGDARLTAYMLQHAFGFQLRGTGGPETGLDGQRSLLLNQRDVWIVVTTGLAEDHPAAVYVAQHGDGVGVVAFETTDTVGAYATAIEGRATGYAPPTVHEAGADRVTIATVSGFADVVHRLVQREGPRAEFLPGAIAMADGEPAPGPLELIDHAAVCLPYAELEPTVRFYREAFGFSEIFSEYVEVAEQGMDSRVVQSPSGGVTFTLIQPDVSRRRGQLDDFLDWHGGAGVQHVAFRTDDIVGAVRSFSARGVAFATTPSTYYDVLEERLGAIDVSVAELRDVGVLVDRDHWGQMFQIFTQSLHVRRTLFLELIERHGARTFGTSNIKALYEAKERELAGGRQTAAL